MAHGKETPRQKMIGMMYLVLMALLALNVSKDVLNAFAILDEGLIKTLENIEATNDDLIDKFKLQESINPVKTKPSFDKAKEVQRRSKEICDFIESKKIEIITESEGEKTEALVKDNNGEIVEIKGLLIEAKDNADVPAEIMIGDNNKAAGNELKIKIDDFKQWLLDEIVEEKAVSVRQSLMKSLETDREKSHGMEEEKSSSHHEGGWERENFEHLPLSGVITIMSGIQIKVRNSEAEVLRYLLNQIDEGSLKFNTIEPTIIPNSNYIIRGNDYKAQVFLAARDEELPPTVWATEFSPGRKPYDSTITPEGVVIYKKAKNFTYKKLDVDTAIGKAIYKQTGAGVGQRFWGGIIELVGPSGDTVRKTFTQQYQVAEGGVVVSATKMNVFYLGVDNPVDISVAGVNPSKVSAVPTNGRLLKIGGKNIIRPKRPGNCIVSVFAEMDGKKKRVGQQEFRVKIVPPPIAKVNGKAGGAMDKSILMASLGVQAEMENFDFDLKFTITEFTLSTVVGGFVKDAKSKNNRFTNEQKNIIKSLSRGSRIYIQDIKAVGPDGSTRPLSTINFRIN